MVVDFAHRPTEKKTIRFQNMHSQYKIIEWTRQFHGHCAALEIGSNERFLLPQYFSGFHGSNPLQLTQEKEKKAQ